MKAAVVLLIVAAGAGRAQDLVGYDCEFETHVEVAELPRDTLVLWWDDDPAVALTALPTGGYGRLWGTDGLDFRILDDGLAELTTYPENEADEAGTLLERCFLRE